MKRTFNELVDYFISVGYKIDFIRFDNKYVCMYKQLNHLEQVGRRLELCDNDLIITKYEKVLGSTGTIYQFTTNKTIKECFIGNEFINQPRKSILTLLNGNTVEVENPSYYTDKDIQDYWKTENIYCGSNTIYKKANNRKEYLKNIEKYQENKIIKIETK